MGPFNLSLDIRDRENWRFKGRDGFNIRVSPACFEDKEYHMTEMWVAYRSSAAPGRQPVKCGGLSPTTARN